MAEEQFIDPNNYSGQKDTITMRGICLQHLQSLGTLAKKEFKGGYWETKTRMIQGMAFPEKYYVADTFEEYSNGIDFLSDILFPYYDEEMKKAEEEYDKEVKENPKGEKITKEGILLKRKYFRALNSFLHRKGYLESKSYEE